MNREDKLKGLQINACPFANLPERKRTQWALTREEMKNCVWVKPELVVQIEFGEWTPDGHLRHSRFLALRDDKNPHEVIREILTGCSRSATSAPLARSFMHSPVVLRSSDARRFNSFKCRFRPKPFCHELPRRGNA